MTRLFDANTLVERQLNHLASWVHDQPQWWNQLTWDLEELDQQIGVLQFDRIFPLSWMEHMHAVASNLALLIDFKLERLANGLMLASFESLLLPLVRHLKTTVPHVPDNVTPTGMLGVMLCDGILDASVLDSVRGFATNRRKVTADPKSTNVQLVNPFLNMVSNRTYRSTTRNALFAEVSKVQWIANKCYWLPSTFAVSAEGKVSIESYINDIDLGLHGPIAAAFETLLPCSSVHWKLGSNRNSNACHPSEPNEFSGTNFRSNGRISSVVSVCVPTFRAQPWLPWTLRRLCCANRAMKRDWQRAHLQVKRRWKLIQIIVKRGSSSSFIYTATDIAHNLAQPLRAPIPMPTLLRNRNLRVVTRMMHIHLTPENPEYKGCSWQAEEFACQQVVATAVVFLEASNISASRLTFRQTNTFEYNYSAHYIERIDGTTRNDVDRLYGFQHGESSRAEVVGQISAVENRAVVFPTVYKHRLEPFSLLDPQKDGHRTV
ncbi:hypothetical protein HDU81_008741, partial [Chytriomyces hyalinus]